jgi:integrase
MFAIIGLFIVGTSVEEYGMAEKAKKPQRETNKLAAVKLKQLRPGLHGDGGGLWLQVTTNRRGRSWVFRYSFNGRAREMGLGSLNTIGLADAREQAKECRRLLQGSPTTPPVDPIEHRRALHNEAKLAATKAKTFKGCAEAYMAAHQGGWRNPKHAAQWPATLGTYVYPVMGDVPVDRIDTALVTKVLEPIWQTKPETASRVRGRIEAVLDWAKAADYRNGDNPARWRGHLQNLLMNPSSAAKAARRSKGRGEHHAALPYRDIGAFMAELRQEEGVAARALEFAVLTAARTSEVVGAKWEEVDDGVWTVPAERMKAGKEHRVPLSKPALALVEKMAEIRDGEFLFPGGKSGRPLSNMSMLMLLRRMGRGDLTAHGFRSTFRDWAGDCTDFPREVAEMALAHTLGDKVEAAYRRGDGFQKRRVLAEAWAMFCGEAKPEPADEDVAKVVPLRRRRAKAA